MSEKIRCKKCRKLRAQSSFNKDETRPDGLFPWCKPCLKKHDPATKFQDPTAPLNGHVCPLCDTPCRGRSSRRFCSDACRSRSSSLVSIYGLSVPDYRRLVDATEGVCPICRKVPSVWHVDHNHKTGKATGTVCQVCNIGSLATTFHDIEYVERLLAYLKRTPCEELGIEATAPEGVARPSSVHKMWGVRRAG